VVLVSSNKGECCCKDLGFNFLVLNGALRFEGLGFENHQVETWVCSTGNIGSCWWSDVDGEWRLHHCLSHLGASGKSSERTMNSGNNHSIWGCTR